MKEPVFICGLGRSGTSWLCRLLDQSPQINYIGEAWMLGKLSQMIEWHEELYTQWGGFTSFSKQDLNQEMFVGHVGNFYAGLLETLASGVRYVEKTPHWNAEYLPLLSRLFPKAYFILVYRDGRNYVASMESKRTKKGQSFDFETECRRWQKVMSLFSDVKQNNLIDKHLFVRYENLVEKLDTEFLNVCNFIEVDHFQPELVPPNSAFENCNGPMDFNYRYKALEPHKQEVFNSIAGKTLINWRYT